MARRHNDALYVQMGACNPRAVARSLVQALDDAAAERPSTDQVRRDEACRLICHQLAHLMGVYEVDHDAVTWRRLVDTCSAMADESVVKLFNYRSEWR